MIFSFALFASNSPALHGLMAIIQTRYTVQCSVNNSLCVVGGYRAKEHADNMGYTAHNSPLSPADSHLSSLFSGSHHDGAFAEVLSKINGPFTYIKWDNDTQTLHAACDPLAQYSLYYAQVENGFVISSEASFIRHLMAKRPTLSEEGLACWLAGLPNPSVSLYNEIKVIPTAHSLSYTPEKGVKLNEYWKIDPLIRSTHNNDNAYAAEFREVLENAVKYSIGDGVSHVASQMSGGMDSSSVTALAALYQHSNNNTLTSLSHYYANSPDSDERQLIHKLQAALNCDDALLMAADADKYADFMQLYPTDYDSPGTVLSSRYHDEFALLASKQAGLLLTGNGGDEMCWGHSLAYTQRLKQGDIGVISEVYKACKLTGMPFSNVAKSVFVRPFLPQWLLSAARWLKGNAPRTAHGFPLWMTSQALQLAEQGLDIGNPFDEKRDPVHHARYLNMKTTSTFNSVRSYQKVGAQYGIPVSHPFFDKHLAQHSFTVPLNQLIRGAYPKWLLRSAMTDVLPDEVCWNTHKTTFDQHFTALVRANAPQLRACLEHPLLADMGLLNPAILLKQFDNVVHNSEGFVTVDLLYAILTQCWITQHHID